MNVDSEGIKCKNRAKKSKIRIEEVESKNATFIVKIDNCEIKLKYVEANIDKGSKQLIQILKINGRLMLVLGDRWSGIFIPKFFDEIKVP